jgi:hypothetical protein
MYKVLEWCSSPSCVVLCQFKIGLGCGGRSVFYMGVLVGWGWARWKSRDGRGGGGLERPGVGHLLWKPEKMGWWWCWLFLIIARHLLANESLTSHVVRRIPRSCCAVHSTVCLSGEAGVLGGCAVNSMDGVF